LREELGVGGCRSETGKARKRSEEIHIGRESVRSGAKQVKYRSKADETRERRGQMKEAEQTRYRDRAGEAQKRKKERGEKA